MKGYAAAAAAAATTTPPAKRRWSCLGATVLVLVFGSLLVPLGFLLGGFPSGYLTDERPSREPGFDSRDQLVIFNREEKKSLEGDDDEVKIKDLLNKFAPPIPKVVIEDNLPEAEEDNETHSNPTTASVHVTLERKNATPHLKLKDSAFHSNGSPAAQTIAQKSPSPLSTRGGAKAARGKGARRLTADENGRSCQLEFGSYCLWSIEHKEVLRDPMVKRLKDQLFVARAYYPSIAKLQGQEKLTRELKQHIQEHEKMLSEAISDADLPSFVEKNILKMDQIIERAKSCTVDCNNVDKKLRQILYLTEDEAHFHMKQSAFLYHLGAQTMPKSLHCLSMRLTVEHFKSTLSNIEESHSHEHDSPSIQHYAIFSRNILAVSVSINSTVMNAKESGDMFFYVLTDRQNFFAMTFWFTRNSYKKAKIHVLNIEDLNLNYSYDPVLPLLSSSEEFRVSIRNTNQSSTSQMKTKYISVFGHSHFLLPEIFKNLKKVVVLDDDVVIQRDLSSLWDIDLGGKVIGAVEFCELGLGQLKSYFGGISHDGNACAWASGLNIIDLEKWREDDVTRIYQQLLPKLQNGKEESWRAAALPISLLAFQDLVHALDDSWLLSGLGHDYGVSRDTIRNSVALHYNGNMKPWLDIGIPRYKKYWKKFLNREERFMAECNVNP